MKRIYTIHRREEGLTGHRVGLKNALETALGEWLPVRSFSIIRPCIVGSRPRTVKRAQLFGEIIVFPSGWYERVKGNKK